MKQLADSRLAAPGAIESLQSALTLNDEIGLDVVVESLPTADRAAWEALMTHGSDLEVVSEGATHIVAVETATTRPRLLTSAHAPKGFECTLSVRAPQAALEMQAERYETLLHRRQQGIQNASDWIRGLSREDVDRRLSYIVGAFAHAGPVIAFVEETTFTNVYEPPNLTGGAVRPGSPRCSLTALTKTSRNDWSSESIQLFFALTHVASIGPTSIIKEINYSQLGYWEPRQYLLQRFHYWRQFAEHSADPSAMSSEELVALVGETRAMALANPNYVRYRNINGRTFRKLEECFERPITIQSGKSSYELISAAEPGERSGLAIRLLREVLATALQATGSHYVMSRGVRDYGLLNRLCREGDFETAMRWEPDHFFCLVMRSSDIVGGPENLRAISERMKYNTWHFLPDVLRLLGATPLPGRDYFFAPKDAPDIAFHEDRVHRGHVAAQIKYSARFPRYVRVLGESLPGLADLRLARITGPSYGPADLQAMWPLAEEISQIHQAMADFGLALGPEEKEYDDEPSHAIDPLRGASPGGTGMAS